ncbi:MAG TPA: hypothetical protein VHD36_14685 [Pirellulales bacterium]|nr:hypothetical protein [Pirellulales bacterium]
MSVSLEPNQPRPILQAVAPVLGWGALGLLFTLPVICRSLALEAGGEDRTAVPLVLSSLGVTAAGLGSLVIFWKGIVARLGNAGLATIASIAALQFTVSYAARVLGSVAGAILGPMYVFVDGVGSKGLSCLFLGVLVALLPRPGALALALSTLFSLNVLASGQVGLTALLFLTVSIVLHEGLAAALGLTVGKAEDPRTSRAARLWFSARVGLAIGAANGLSLYTQYALFEVLLRLYFDAWYKIAVSLITGFIFGGIGASIGALVGLRLRRAAP